jgi:hypothetical protein
MYLKEIGCRAEDWIFVAQDSDQWQALVILLMKIQLL